MAKLSVSLQDELAEELRREAGNVSAFVSDAVRDALDRRRLARALEELDSEFGEVDAELIVEAQGLFDRVDAVVADATGRAVGRQAPTTSGRRPEKTTTGRSVTSSATGRKTAPSKAKKVRRRST